MLLILMGLIYLYYKRDRFGGEHLQKFFLSISPLLFMYLIFQFDPYLCFKRGPVFNDFFLITSSLLAATLIAWGSYILSLKGEKRGLVLWRPDLKRYDKGVLITASILVLLSIVTYAVDVIFSDHFFWLQGSVYIRLFQCFILYFLLSRLLYVSGNVFKRYLMRFVIGALAVVGLLSAWQLTQLFNRSTAANVYLTSHKWDVAADAYIDLIDRNTTSFNLFRFTLDETINRLKVDSLSNSAGKHYVLGRITFEKGRLEEASAYFKKAINDSSNSPTIPLERCFAVRSQILMKVANWKELLNNSLGGLQISPQNLDFMLQAGIAYAKTYDYERSFSLLQSALNVVPEKGGESFLDYFPQNRLVNIDAFLPERLRTYKNLMFLYELARILGMRGHEVFYPGEKIGSTGVRTPAEIYVRSAGYGFGMAWILVNGRDLISEVGVGRGYNMAILNPDIGEVWKMGKFDASDVSPAQGRAMLDFVDSAPNGWIVIATVSDNASNLTEDGVRALRKIGSIRDVRGKSRWGHIVIGVKGATPGTAVEVTGQTQIDAYVLADRFKLGTKDALEEIQNRVKKTGRGALYITGLKPNDKMAWIPSSN